MHTCMYTFVHHSKSQHLPFCCYCCCDWCCCCCFYFCWFLLLLLIYLLLLILFSNCTKYCQYYLKSIIVVVVAVVVVYLLYPNVYATAYKNCYSIVKNSIVDWWLENSFWISTYKIRKIRLRRWWRWLWYRCRCGFWF